MPAALAAVAIGSNLGDRAAHILAAVAALSTLPRSTLRALSPVYETAPVGPISQGPYLNAAALLDTSLSPRDLLRHIHAIEHSRGRDRDRERRWGPRTLDLDLLLVGDAVLDLPGLTLPHPHLRQRPFVLVPLADIAATLLIPASTAGPATTVGAALACLRASGDVSPGAVTLYHQA